MADLSKNDLRNIKEVFAEALEPFAKAVQQDFNKVDKRFDGVENRLGGIENRLVNVEFDLREVKKDVQEIKNNSYELFAKLDEFISLYKSQAQELTILREQVRRLEDRMAKLEMQKP